MKVYSTDIVVYSKDDNSPLTEADRRSHQVLVRALEGTYPVLSEEGVVIPYMERSAWHTFWLIDPLDGTKEFIRKNGEFTVNVALVKDGEPVAGWVYLPVRDVLYIGHKQGGARRILSASKQRLGQLWNNGARLPYRDPFRPLTAVASRSHMNESTTEYLEKLREVNGSLELVSAGSSLKLCMVAEGSADVYPRFGLTMEWDTAAADAVCRAAGSTVINAETGEPLEYNKEDLHNPHFLVLSATQKELLHELV